MKKIVLFIVLIMICSSCDVEETYKLVKIDNKFSIEVLESMTETNQLNAEATLQYQNLFQELYTVIIEESEQDLKESIENKIIDDFSLDIFGYTNLIKQNFENLPSITKVSPTTDLIINGKKAKTFTVDGKINDIEIFYLVTIVKGSKTFYQITSWTLLDKKEKVSPKYEKIAKTFKEIKTKTIAK